MIRLQSFLSGRWQDGEGEGAALRDPSTEEVVARTSTAGLDLGAALSFARERGGPALRALSFAERGAMLSAMSKLLHAERDALIEVSAKSAGTPRGDAKFDIDGAAGTLAYYGSLGKKLGDRRWLAPDEGEQLTRSARFWGYHIELPLRGVAVHVNAFNFPAWGFAEKAAVALLAGVPVVTKPATATAWLTYECVKRILDAEILPEGTLSLVCGGAGDLLTHLRSQDALAFTGSAETGRTLRSLPNVIEHSVRVNVEADSLNSTVVAPGTERGSEVWQLFVRDVAREVTQKSGQKCTATRRVFVPKELLEAAQEDLVEELKRTKVGVPGDEGVRMGPLTTAQQKDDVLSGIRALMDEGAELTFRGEAPEGKGYFVPVSLLTQPDPTQATQVHQLEVFGPVATLMPYEGVAQVIELVARGGGSLLATIYGDDKRALSELILGLAPHSGRVLVGSKKVAEQTTPPGMVLPSCVHGGPGRAGGGEELGGLRGLRFYLQRTAVQGDRALLARLLDVPRGD